VPRQAFRWGVVPPASLPGICRTLFPTKQEADDISLDVVVVLSFRKIEYVT
jgi:hypothetical protein